MICNHDCFNCTYDDCISNETTYEEYKQLDYFDYLIYLERRNERQKIQYKYNHSAKGISARERYSKSEKGKSRDKRRKQKQIASGKNAEYCRRYYLKKKAEKEKAKIPC